MRQPMRWAAFDFETATSRRDSACAVGVVVVEDGAPLEAREWLIRPPRNAYSHWNIDVHGIHPADTEDAPSFGQVWTEVEWLVGDRPLVAHNASFDLSVLRACAESSGVDVVCRHVWCTVALARRAWPHLRRWNLPTVATHIGADLDHHEALSDARACSDIVVACIEKAEVTGLAEAAELLGVRPNSTRRRAPARS